VKEKKRRGKSKAKKRKEGNPYLSSNSGKRGKKERRGCLDNFIKSATIKEGGES